MAWVLAGNLPVPWVVGQAALAPPVNRSYRMSNWRERVALIGMALAVAGASLMASQATPPAVAASPLTLSASCTGSGQSAALHIRIENKSGREIAFVFGRMIGSTNVIDALNVLTIRPATGATEAYPYVNPKHASLTGRATPWIVTIPLVTLPASK
jgi:hypothetical protein